MEMSLDVVKKFAEESGNEELLSAVKGIGSSMSANLDRIGYLEKELQGTISKRDRQAELVKAKLGLEELTEDALEKALQSKAKQGTPEFEAEKSKLEQMIAALQEEKTGLSSKYEQTVNMGKIERSLNELGAAKDANGQKAYDILLAEVTQNAVFDNGNLVFKANDGTTVRNTDGTPMTLADKYNQLKESEGFKFLFVETKPKSGSGTQGTKGGSTQTLSRGSMTNADKAKFITEHGQNAYLKLPK
jgi:hypothetical protein